MDSEKLAESIQKYSDEFDELCRQRHEMGAEKYGPGKFLTVDTLEEALFELSDLSNYARYTFVRIRLLQERLAAELRPDFTKNLNE